MTVFGYQSVLFAMIKYIVFCRGRNLSAPGYLIVFQSGSMNRTPTLIQIQARCLSYSFVHIVKGVCNTPLLLVPGTFFPLIFNFELWFYASRFSFLVFRYAPYDIRYAYLLYTIYALTNTVAGLLLLPGHKVLYRVLPD